MKGLLFIGIVFGLFANAMAVDTLKLSKDGLFYLGEKSEYLELPAMYDLKQIENLPDWNKTKHNAFKLKNKQNELWVKWSFFSEHDDHIYLSALTPNLDYLEAFANGLSFGVSGDLFTISERSTQDAFPVVVVHVTKGVQTIYLKVRMSEDFMIPLVAQSEQSYRKLKDTRQFFTGLYTGGMLLIFCYNLLLFVSVRRRVFVFYMAYVCLVSLTQLSIFSNVSAILYPESLFWIQRDIYVFSSVLGVAIAPFVFELISLKKHSRLMYYVIILQVALYPICFIISLTEYLHIAMQILVIVNMSGSFTLLLSGMIIIKKEPMAKYFVIAWGLFLSGVILFAMENLQIINYNLFHTYLMQLGTAFESVLLSLALSYQYNMLRKSNRKNELLVAEYIDDISYLNKQITYFALTQNAMKMKPHFVFNTLTSIQSYLFRNKPEKAAALLKQYAHATRESMDMIDTNMVPLSKEIDFITSLVKLENNKGETEYDFKVYSENIDLGSYMIAPMILQPFVENCLKHAFMRDIDTAVIFLYVVLDESNNLISIFVGDNGIGMANKRKSDHRSQGIDIVKERLAAIGNLREDHIGSVRYISGIMKGTVVKIEIPIIHKNEEQDFSRRRRKTGKRVH